jgi:hypothetical protein
MAFAIAAAGVLDPALNVSGASRPRLAIVALRSAARDDVGVRDRLVRDLSGSFEIVANITSDAAAAVLIGDRIPDDPVPDTLRVATVTMAENVEPGVRIVRVDAPREIPPATVIHLNTVLEARGQAGRSSDVIAAIAGLDVGRASHRWTRDVERWRASLDVVPVGEPPYAIRIRVPPSPTVDGGTATRPGSVVSASSRTVADVVVDVRRTLIRVEFYDPRPSWATTFVRRALEADRRFQVATISSTSRGVAAQTPGAVALTDPRLDTFEVVVVGGLERLTAAEGRALDRYMRERGGAVVLAPDRRIEAGPAHDLVSDLSAGVRHQPELTERLLERAATIDAEAPATSLRASELLTVHAPSAAADVIARVPGAQGGPVVVSTPHGEGRLLLSGALDAWRFRAADDGAFDRFWQSTIAGLALNVPPPIALRVDPQIVRPGGRASVMVRVRSRQPGGVSASLVGEQPIRLLPNPEPGEYRGEFVAGNTTGRSIVEARSAEGERTDAPVLVQADASPVREPNAPMLSLSSSSHRGIDVTPEHLADLERFLRQKIVAPRTPLVRHPMRSMWWISAFVFCVSTEWWMRRRQGLR